MLLSKHNPSYGIKIQYPSNWKRNYNYTDERFVRFAEPDEKIANVVVGVHDYTYLNRSLTQSDLKSVKDEHIRRGININEKGFRLIDSNTNSVLLNNRAYNYTYTYPYPNFGTLRVTEIGTVLNNKVYYLQFFSEPSRYNDLLPVALRMIRSFSLSTN